MENKLKKSYLTINTLEKNIKRKENKIQSIMDELSVCKQSKIKYINENSNSYKVINENDNDNLVNSNNNTVLVPDARLQNKPNDNHDNNSLEEKMKFIYPDDIIGECKKSDIHRVFHNLSPYFKKCFKSNNIKKGIIGYSWIINESGDVLKVNLTKNNIFNKNLSGCLEAIIKKGRYNSPKSGICTVTYIFKL